jgi:hypothetical protein
MLTLLTSVILQASSYNGANSYSSTAMPVSAPTSYSGSSYVSMTGPILQGSALPSPYVSLTLASDPSTTPATTLAPAPYSWLSYYVTPTASYYSPITTMTTPATTNPATSTTPSYSSNYYQYNSALAPSSVPYGSWPSGYNSAPSAATALAPNNVGYGGSSYGSSISASLASGYNSWSYGTTGTSKPLTSTSVTASTLSVGTTTLITTTKVAATTYSSSTGVKYQPSNSTWGKLYIYASSVLMGISHPSSSI